MSLRGCVEHTLPCRTPCQQENASELSLSDAFGLGYLQPAEYQEGALLNLSLWNWRRQNYISGPARAAVRRAMETILLGGEGEISLLGTLESSISPGPLHHIHFKILIWRLLLAFHILWGVRARRQTGIRFPPHDIMPVFILSSGY